MKTKTIAAAAVLAVSSVVGVVVASRAPEPPRLPCVRAPLDGGTDCQRMGTDRFGGPRYFGAGNAFPVGLAIGTQCEPCPCTVMFGNNPAVDP
jgi:hypothetical protein